MTTAAIYLRLSAKSKGQRNIVNLDTQEADCRKLADEIGATVIATFTEYGESAFDRDNPDDRPQYAELCDMVRAKQVDVVIAWHTDRLWRDDLEKALFVRDAQRAGLQLVVTKTARIDPSNPDDEFLLSILTAVAKKESADKRRRIKSKMAANALAGKPHGSSNRPFGFESDRVTIREPEAVVLREMSERILNGETLHSVAKWLGATGVTTTRGNPLGTTAIRDILINPRYAGQRAVGKRNDARIVAKAVWPAIIDEQTSDRLRVLLLDPARRTNRTARSYLLSGMLRCARCDEKLVSHPRWGRLEPDGQKMRLYSCRNDGAHPLACNRNTIRSLPLEAMIGQAVARQFVELSAAGAFDEPPDTINASITAELAAIDAKSAHLGREWASDRMTSAAHDAIQRQLVERRSQLSAMVTRRVATVPPIFAEIDPATIVDDFKGYDFGLQRTLITALVDRIVIAPPPVPNAAGFDDSRVQRIHWRNAAN